MKNDFLTKSEQIIFDEYLKNGFIISDVIELDSLELISDSIWKSAKSFIGEKSHDLNKIDFFNKLHTFLTVKELNEFRIKIIHEVNKNNYLRNAYYKIAREILNSVVGNEIAMQLRLNLSIQIPGDTSSLLPIHADTWSGDSPYEVVVWLPLVDCYKTKSMYILPQNKKDRINEIFDRKKNLTSDSIYKELLSDLVWLNVRYGQVLVFNQGLPHGNVVNEIDETRWSINCRFKAVYTPYMDKKIGEFFEPIIVRPATLIAGQYKFPKI